MEIRELYLDKNTSTTIHGNLYGLDYQIEEAGYQTKVYLDLYNDRIRVIKYRGEDITGLTRRLDYLAEKNSFGKVFLKARSDEREKFLPHGYVLEGIFKHYFNGEHAYCLSKFYSQERRLSYRFEEATAIMEDVSRIEPDSIADYPVAEGFALREATSEDIPALCKLYKSVFKTYPIPLNDPTYLELLLASDYYFIVATDKDGRIVSCASADMSTEYGNAEITDCASLPEMRGKGLMAAIINALELEMKKRDISCLYSLARALSPGMNTVFRKHGYTFTGRLVNNCNIFGKFEDMNLWVKKV